MTTEDYFKIIDEFNIGGLHLHYLYICKRKLWLHLNGIEPNPLNSHIQTGKLAHDKNFISKKSFKLYHSIQCDGIENSTIIEYKKSLKNLDSIKAQLGFYIVTAYLLKLNISKGEIRNYSGKLIYTLPLTDDLVVKIQNDLLTITYIYNNQCPPLLNNKLCKQCAYEQICYA